MDPVQTASTMLTATTLVFAGSSFLIGQLQDRALDELRDERAEEYKQAAYFAIVGGFGFMIVTTASLVMVIAPDLGPFHIIDVPDRHFVGFAGYTFLAALGFPSMAAIAICQALYRENREPLQLDLLSDRFDR